MSRRHLHPYRIRSQATWRCLNWTVGVLLLGCFLQTAAAGTSANPDSSAATGRRMFFGEDTLQAAIAGHAESLPPRMVSCSNCHLGEAGLGAGRSFAPLLDRQGMTELVARRGGPPSAFSLASFCRTLRTGVDPAYILITRRMPRYAISDDQCLDLWHYVMGTSH